MPALPSPGEPVLIRVATAPSRQQRAQELRSVLREVLAAWSGFSPEQLPLRETARGPVWPGQWRDSLDISLSYAANEGWIGLRRGGQIGVDAMPVEPFPEAEAVAKIFSVSQRRQLFRYQRIRQRPFRPPRPTVKARLKCLKRELNEWPVAQAFVTTDCASQSVLLPDRLMVTVVVRSESGSLEVSQSKTARWVAPRRREFNFD